MYTASLSLFPPIGHLANHYPTAADHIETLHELDLEIIGEMKQPGIKRAESLNGDPKFIEALADIAKKHLESGDLCSRQMSLRCPMCVSARCQEQKVSSSPHADGK